MVQISNIDIEQVSNTDMLQISNITKEFLAFEQEIKNCKNTNKPIFHHKMIYLTHKLICEIIKLSDKYDKAAIIKELDIIRQIQYRSPFLRRMQDWPLGYQGDYLTIEKICTIENKSKKGTLEFLNADYALKGQITQQHRNKINIQSLAIVESVVSSKKAKVLLYAAGGAFDLRKIQQILEYQKDYQIIINDLDADALQFAKERLSPKILENIEFVNNNIISQVRKIAREIEAYDLILFGGIFDYLTDKQIKFILTNSYKNLKRGGKLMFTNININNPYKYYMEYWGDWELIERSQQQNKQMCLDAGIPQETIYQYLEETGLTNIVEVKKSTILE